MDLDFLSYIVVRSMIMTLPPKLKTWVFLFAFGCLVNFACAQNKVQQKLPEKTRILFVLDGSGSMEAAWGSPNESRMDIAKRILTKLVDSLRANADLELALRVYGHRFSRQANNCQDSKLEVPFALKNHTTIVNKIKEIKPKGVTPITYSLLQAANDFPAGKGSRNILILITDGIESCGADPCAVSLELQRKGVFLRPFVIGLGIKGGKALNCVGKYIESDNDKSFNAILNESIETTFAKTTVSVELLNSQNQPKETNINVSFINSMTGTSAYEFVHYRDKLGRPDSVQIDPVLSYDIIAGTLPPMRIKDVTIVNGKHNVINIPVPQGSLLVKLDGKGPGFSILVHQPGKTELLNLQRSGDSYRYLSGDYEVETVTLPKRMFKVTIEPEKVKTITIPQSGLINVNSTVPGYGSLFEILETGESKWVCNLADNVSMHSYNLLPGSYKISFRARQAGGSKYTAIKMFDVKSNETQNLSMFR
jgi:Ca-activated chloride channel family protein